MQRNRIDTFIEQVCSNSVDTIQAQNIVCMAVCFAHTQRKTLVWLHTLVCSYTLQKKVTHTFAISKFWNVCIQIKWINTLNIEERDFKFGH